MQAAARLTGASVARRWCDAATSIAPRACARRRWPCCCQRGSNCHQLLAFEAQPAISSAVACALCLRFNCPPLAAADPQTTGINAGTSIMATSTPGPLPSASATRTTLTHGNGAAASIRARIRANTRSARRRRSRMPAPNSNRLGACSCRSASRPILRHGARRGIGPLGNMRVAKLWTGQARASFP
jgi:hypothetical protein